MQRAAQQKLQARTQQLSETVKLPDPQAKQAQFLSTPADIALYGGSAGSGKTFAALLLLAQFDRISVPLYRAVVFRTSYPAIAAPGSIWDDSQELYRDLGGKPNNSKYLWTFPSGASIKMSYLSRLSEAYGWKGAQLDTILFEELTEFRNEGEDVFWYLLSRGRSRAGLPVKIRATTNPDADSWVRPLIDWWIGDDGYPIPERSGVLRWFVRRGDELTWGATREELIVNEHDDPKSFTFISGKVTDNQKLLDKNPGYIGTLESLHPVERERLLKGNWNIRFQRGEVYQARWFRVVDPQQCNNAEYIYHCRFWDLAGTPRGVSKNAYYTVGVLISVTVGLEFVVQDVIYAQVSAGDVPQLMLKTARSDGQEVMVVWEKEPATGGLFFSAQAKKILYEFSTFSVLPKDSKRARALPYATAASQGKVLLREAKWNKMYALKLEEFDGTPEPLVADLSDASAGAYKFLANKLTQRMQLNNLTGSLHSHMY